MFISFEGGEGSGKTTQVARLEKRLRSAGHRVVLVHEPGSTALGDYLRDWLKGDKPISTDAELLLFEAARAQLVEQIIRPALQAGLTVIADRFADSTLAYQGGGRGIDWAEIEALNRIATRGLVPDVTFLLEVPPKVALTRLAPLQIGLLDDPSRPPDEVEDPLDQTSLRVDEQNLRKFERMSAAFHKKVLSAYLKLANQEPNRWVTVDGTQKPGQITGEIWRHVEPRLPSGNPTAGGNEEFEWQYIRLGQL